MSSIIRTAVVASRATAQVSASSSRSIATSAIRQAGGGGKGKGSKSSAVVKKKITSSYGAKTKKGGDSGSGGSGGSGSSSKTSINISFADAKPAPDLSDLPKLHADAYAPLYAGKAVTFPRPAFDSIKKFGLPRRIGHELDSAGGPACVVRKETLELATLLDKAKAEGSSRHVLCGERGSGKSVLLLQATNYALQSGWIVVYVPNAISWIDSSSAYQYDAESQTFHQPALAAKMLEQIRAVNGSRLDSLQYQPTDGASSAKLPDGRQVQPGTKLSDLAAMGEDHAVSTAVLRLLLGSLANQTQTPVLLAIDEAQVLFDTSLYRTPDFVRVESYQLSMPLLALDLISGRTPLKSGSVLLSYSHTSPNWPLTDTFCSALSLPTSHPITPYTPIQPTHAAHLQGLQKIAVPRCTPEEALGFFDIYRRKGWTQSGDESLMAALSASNGNLGLFGKSLGRTLQMARA